jgi:hypothetical protein
MATLSEYDVVRTERIAAPASRVYDIIADYHVGHPSILPPQFRNMVVVKGGRGAGTVTNFEVRAFGRDSFSSRPMAERMSPFTPACR